ncbi:hypothetical protein WMY93_027834 [Mugilogobius chulae]|uniref:Uncharacterized protein n=1 Tax=Mugilogobius chulae TaxID=88201 RepID=A0AAW0MXI3_9GOBI
MLCTYLAVDTEQEPKEISKGPEEDELTMESEIRQNIQMIYGDYLAQKRGEVGSEPDVHPALEKLLKERKKGSTENFDFSKPMALYLNTYQQHIFRSEGTTKVKENCISAATRAKIFVAYLKLATPRPHWEWTFLNSIDIIRAFPSVLCRVGLVPTTVVGYLQNISAFLQYFADQPPSTYSGRVITAHQQVTKANKLNRLIPKEKLQKCQQLAFLCLDEMEKAPTLENKWKYLFYGYFTAYFASIYGHRTNVFTNMTQKEVANAHRNEDMGYTIDVMLHKTAQTYGVAQLFVYKHKYDWCLRWLKLLEKHPTTNKYFLSSSGAGPIKDMRSYMARAWCHMGLGPAPTFIDLRTAVYEKCYALHKTVKHAQEMRACFVALSVSLKCFRQRKMSPSYRWAELRGRNGVVAGQWEGSLIPKICQVSPSEKKCPPVKGA